MWKKDEGKKGRAGLGNWLAGMVVGEDGSERGAANAAWVGGLILAAPAHQTGQGREGNCNKQASKQRSDGRWTLTKWR